MFNLTISEIILIIYVIISIVITLIFFHYLMKGMKKLNSMNHNHDKLALLHFIKTDKNEYLFYNVNPSKIQNSPLIVEDKNGKIICYDKISDEALGLIGGDSFSSFMKSSINIIRDRIEKKNEKIIFDKKVE